MLMDDEDTRHAADLLIEQHGSEAERFATRRVDDMVAADDRVGKAVWNGIRDAIRDLQQGRGDLLH